ncbi:hypothetical protein KVR01_007890 [Diaporthe batatas]|uniref:uncharacterized protein n=1 Tax=Diaporthe batatas TaxID=748121 RepID=UPI001D045BD7|nr:uncharacterized protein KVR01_007890 [Diaporthe batatas]KAG8162125.1 hypothetical protein KVR01_007890 [Diaporthe batatas]
MDPRQDFDRLVSSITFSGSLISFIATTCVLISYAYYRREQRSFRHALVFNLALAEFVNTLNNTISGIIYLRDHALYPGTACTVNGFIGQMSVQASDFSILVIALVTLLTITRTTYMPDASRWRKIGICVSVWVVPLITATIATAMGKMGPVSGNWCWIMRSQTGLRYALTHGWRIAIIFFTAGIYIFVWWYMNRHFRSMVSTTITDLSGATDRSRRKRRGFNRMGRNREEGDAERQDTELSTVSKSRISRVLDDQWEMSAPEAAYVRENEEDINDDELTPGGRKRARSRASSICSVSDSEPEDYNHIHNRIIEEETQGQQQQPPTMKTTSNRKAPPTALNKSKFDATATTESEFPQRRRTRQMEREIKRMLLLNAYPIMYVLLWIPGLVNRFLEATGNTSQSRVLAALQSSSQFVGLANALTYGFNTTLRKKIKVWWRRKGRKGRADRRRTMA